MLRARQQVQQRHPHGHAVGHLRRDHRARVHGHVGRDLDALVHRPRVHHHHVGRGGSQPLLREPVARGVLAQGRQQAGRHPLLLDPQRHHDVRVPERGVDVGRDREPAAGGAPGGPGLEPAQQRGRAAQPEVRAHRRQRPDVGARHPRVERVAQDHDLAALERAARQPRAQRVQVQQRLADGCACQPSPPLSTDPAEHLRGEVRRPGHAVAHHQHVGAERLDRADRVHEATRPSTRTTRRPRC